MNAPQSLIVPCQIGPDHEPTSGVSALMVPCHRCGEDLEICQPRAEEPAELLGVCQCGAWHYIAHRRDRSEVLVALLPLEALATAPVSSPDKAVVEAPTGDRRASRSRRRA